jgi:hypothetical protein
MCSRPVDHYLWLEAILDDDCSGGSWEVHRRTGAPAQADDGRYWNRLFQLLQHFGRQGWELVEISDRIGSSSPDRRTMTYQREEQPTVWDYIYIETVRVRDEEDLIISVNEHEVSPGTSWEQVLAALNAEGWEIVYKNTTDCPDAVLKRKG